MIFKEKYFSRYILIADQISLSDYLYFLRYLQYVYCNSLCSNLRRHKFCDSLSFLIKLFPTQLKKSGQKCKYLKNGKSFSDEIKTIIHKGLSLKQIKPTFLDSGSQTLVLQNSPNETPFSTSLIGHTSVGRWSDYLKQQFNMKYFVKRFSRT